MASPGPGAARRGSSSSRGSTSGAAASDRRRRGLSARGASSPAESLALACYQIAARESEDVWPSPKYAADPVLFCREVLGLEPWSRQIEVIEAVRDFPRVAVASGHKTGKSAAAVALALWFFCSFADARVVMSAPTSRQVNTILWRELRMLVARARRSFDCEPAKLAQSGLKARDFREIVGFTAREPEAVAGVSGSRLLYILDEASGINEDIFEAIEGNRAGGARVVMFSNPTRTTGEFYAAFRSKGAFYKAIRISSEETPNVVEGREVIPGLATRAWVDEKREEWGEDSPLYKIRVKGDHVEAEDGKIIPVHMITEAEARWSDAVGEGQLHVGLDPAGPGGAGDESVFVARRGLKLLGIHVRRGLTDEGHLIELLGFLREHRRGSREMVPRVKIDREGPIGSSVYYRFRAYLEANPGAFELVAVRSSSGAMREPNLYDRVRDELWARMAEWIRQGGAIPEDVKLAAELHAPEWRSLLNSKLKATEKDELKKLLGRSPDRADAACLAVWEPSLLETDAELAAGGAAGPGGTEEEDLDAPLDPYQANLWYGRK